MYSKSKSFCQIKCKSSLKNRTAREPNCTIITVSTGKGFSHFQFLLTNKGCASSLSGRSSSKMAKPVKIPNASEECFDVEMTSINFRSGLLLFFSILFKTFTCARGSHWKTGCFLLFLPQIFPSNKKGFERG